MNPKRWIFIFLSISILAFCGVSYSQETEIIKELLKAFDSNDQDRITAIVEEKQEEVLAEIRNLVDQAMLPETTEAERGSKLYRAGVVAKMYKEVSGDFETLRDVKKISFEVRLSPPVVSVSADSIHIIDMPGVTEEVKNGFNPDNIIIKKGETVRWINSGKTEHIFASTPFIGDGGIFSPSIEPGGKWEYTFENTGKYFYICFIHRSMIGEITVEK